MVKRVIGTRGTAAVLGTAGLVAAVVAGFPGSASAAGEAGKPTRQQLMADCASGTGKCTFNDPVVQKSYLGDYRQVSDTLYNCSSSPVTQGMSWSDTVGSTDSLDVSVTVGGKIAGIVDASVTAKYGHTWSTSHTEGGSLGTTVQPGEVGWISRAQVMHQVSGMWQTHYDNPHWGHYYWYWGDTVTSPAPNGTDGVNNAVVVRSRPMTADEQASCKAGNARVRVGPNLHQTDRTKGAPQAPAPEAPRPGDDLPPAQDRKEDGATGRPTPTG